MSNSDFTKDWEHGPGAPGGNLLIWKWAGDILHFYSQKQTLIF